MKLRNKIADIFGYEIIRKTKNHNLFEGHLPELLKKYGINCVFDIGANQGQYGRTLRRLGYRGRIFSFEPVRKSFDLLYGHCKNDPLWEAYDYAIGSEDGIEVINVTGNSDLSSFLIPSRYLKDNFQVGNSADIRKTEKVQIKKLDSIYESMIKTVEKPRVLLKTDTQGYDLEVIKGAQASIKKVSILQSEIACVPLYENMPDYLEVLGEYRKLGFEITGIFPISRDANDLRVIEFDCIFVRKDFYPQE